MNRIMLIEPGQGNPVSSVEVPTEFYWVLKSPGPLAGMKYPRHDFPWSRLKVAGFSRVVWLEPGSFNPKPLTMLFSERLEDLVHTRPPEEPQREIDRVRRAVVATTLAVRAGEGVVIHCFGGRGRTGTVLGCVLRELSYEADLVVNYLDRLNKVRWEEGWPESSWQAKLVRDWWSNA